MGTQPGQSSLKGAIGLNPHLHEDPMQLTGQGLNKWLSQTQAPNGPLTTGSACYKPAQGMYKLLLAKGIIIKNEKTDCGERRGQSQPFPPI